MEFREVVGALVLVVGLSVASACSSGDDDNSSVPATGPPPATDVAGNGADDEESSSQTSAPPGTGVVDDTVADAPAGIGEDEAKEIADEIAATFAAAEFTPVEELLGDGGVWMALSGDEYDRSTIGAFLASFTDASGIGSHVVELTRVDETVEGLEGYWFKMNEVLSNGTEFSFWMFIGRDDDGALVVTERLRPPRS